VQLEDKYEKRVKIRPAIISFRENIGQHGDSAKISFLHSYLKNLGDDADLLREFVSHLHADEEAAPRARYPQSLEKVV